MVLHNISFYIVSFFFLLIEWAVSLNLNLNPPKMSANKGLKSIAPVPTANDFLDIVLSRTQRKTPTVCRSKILAKQRRL